MTSPDPFVGKVIDGRYEIQARIGEGGVGAVYKCRQISIDRIIALKMLDPQMAGDPTWVQRFYNEAKACSRLQHPNTIRIFDFGQTSDSRLFMTMEFLDGTSLRDALKHGPLTPQRVVKILIQCCASLAEAHSIGIIHRNIKPDHVFLLNMAGSLDFVKLLDFSVAKLLEGDRVKTQAGVVFGTPQYMSPEQGRGLPFDARSDLYALGILAYEMLVGNVPFHDENPMTVIQMHVHQQVPPMPETIPYAVQQIVRRALEKDAGRRYQSAGEMMQHAQQVFFAEVSASGMSIGAGGMPRTMVAQQGVAHIEQPRQPHLQQPGMPYPGPHVPQPHVQQPNVQPQPHHFQQPQQAGPAPYQQASPEQKTMIEQMNPFAGGQMLPPPQPGLLPQGPPGAGEYVQASPMQKTIVAGVAAPMPGRPGMMQPGGADGYPHAPPHPSALNKTVVLQPSDGIVSVARTGQPLQPAGTGPIPQGATTLFWIVAIAIGITIGVLAYVLVLQL